MDAEVEHIKYAHPHLLYKFMSEATYDAVVEAVNKYLPRGARILDVGSGRGELLKRFRENGYEAQGCDMDERCVELGRRYGNVQRLEINEITSDRFDGSFDCIVLSHVLEHIENPRESVMRLASMSKGYLIISVPNPHYSPFVLHSLLRMKVGHVNSGHLQSWDWFHFKTFVEVGCGQELVEWFYDSVAIPVPSVIRKPLIRLGLLPLIEQRLLRFAFPRFCRSITAIIRTRSEDTYSKLQQA